jgi:peptide/nickel transport system permease protein
MWRYIIQRIFILIPTWIMLGLIVFFITNLAPGDPTAMLIGTESVNNIERIRENLGLDKSISERLILWIQGLLRGDLGDSFFLGRSVKDAIWERLPVTISLAIFSLFFALSIGMSLGIIAAIKPNGLRDISLMGISIIGLSIPEFFLGLILIFTFSLGLKIFPSGGYAPLSEGLYQWIRHMFLPSFSIGFIWAAYFARLTRSSMLEVLNQEFIVTARAKGQTEFIIVMKHALRNAIIPIVTAIGIVFALTLSGAFITEYLFRLPGAGSLIIAAVKHRDYPIVQGGLIVFSTSILLINLIVDILYAFLDPRIKYGEKS